MTTDTKIDIGSMTAGRELDSMIAEKVMGYTVKDTSSDETPWRQCYGCLYKDDLDDIIEIEPINDDSPASNYNRCLRQYSTDISAAWQLVEPLDENGERRFYFDVKSVVCGGWVCEVHDERKFVSRLHKGGDFASGGCLIACEFSDTAPLAICKAALKAVMDGK